MRFGSVCSGIEAASLAWNPLGWKAAWFSEIEPFPCAVLQHHYPHVPNLGDMRALPARLRAGEIESPDILCGGTPCQAFSVAGDGESLGDDRGALSLTFCEIANAIDDTRGRSPASIVFWENVPGALSTKDNAFGCILAGLAGETTPLVPTGRRWTNAGVVHGPRRSVAWRVLDAQYFGLAQRRKRLFVVASARDDFNPAAVLLELDSMRRDSPPSRRASKDVAGTVAGGARKCGGFSYDDVPLTAGTLYSTAGGADENDAANGRLVAFGGNNTSGPIDVAAAVNAKGGAGRMDFESETFIAFDTTQITSAANRSNPQAGDPCYPLAAAHPPALAFDARQRDVIQYGDVAGSLDTDGWTLGVQPRPNMRVRRLTPRECERLQGIPDDHTLIPGKKANKVRADELAYLRVTYPNMDMAEAVRLAADGPRYKAIGNSWPIPVIIWIGRRIAANLPS